MVTFPNQWTAHIIRKHCRNDDDISMAISWTVMRNSDPISNINWRAAMEKERERERGKTNNIMANIFLFIFFFLDLKVKKCDVAFRFNINRIYLWMCVCVFLSAVVYQLGFGRFSVLVYLNERKEVPWSPWALFLLLLYFPILNWPSLFTEVIKSFNTLIIHVLKLLFPFHSNSFSLN